MLLSFLFGEVGEGRGAVWDGAPGAGVLLIDAGGRIRRLSDGAPGLLGRSRAELLGAPLVSLFAPDAETRIARGLSLGAAAGRVRAGLGPSLNPSLNPGPNPNMAACPEVDLMFSVRPDGRVSALVLPVEAAPLAKTDPESLPAPGAGAETETATGAATGAATGTATGAATGAGAELLADLSHEMRTPLNAVIGFADAMAAETYGPLGHPKYEEYAAIIRASGRHLLDLVSSILDLARIEAGRYALRRETTAIGALARECAAMLRNEAEKAGLRFRVEIADDLPDAALDPRAIRQVVINLLANAIKFTSDGEVALEVRRDGDDILLAVSDTGVGMSAEDLARLGRRFAAGSADGVRGAKGAGLGLSLAIALVELHGGRLAISSAPGEGVRAEARVPIVAPARPQRRLRAVIADGFGVRADAGPDARVDARSDQCDGERSGVLSQASPAPPAILTELERIEAFRRERARSAA